MVLQGIRDDEWRLQRIRPLDWYSVDYKRQTQRELQAKYWTAWSIQVRCYRRAGQPQKAADLLALMDQRVASLHKNSDQVYGDALATLVRLYGEGNQKDAAAQKLNSMQQFLVQHPDPLRTAQLEDLRKLVGKTVSCRPARSGCFARRSIRAVGGPRFQRQFQWSMVLVLFPEFKFQGESANSFFSEGSFDADASSQANRHPRSR